MMMMLVVAQWATRRLASSLARHPSSQTWSLRTVIPQAPRKHRLTKLLSKKRTSTSKSIRRKTYWPLRSRRLFSTNGWIKNASSFKHPRLNRQEKDEITTKIDNPHKAFLQLDKYCGHTEISFPTKTRVFRAAVHPVLNYGCETYPLRVENTRRLEVFDHWCLERILLTNWERQTSNNEIRRRCCNTEQMPIFLQRRRLQRFGHIPRHSDKELPRQPVAFMASWKRGSVLLKRTWSVHVLNQSVATGAGNKIGLRPTWAWPPTSTLRLQWFVMSMEPNFLLAGDSRLTVKVKELCQHLNYVRSAI